MFNTAFFCVGHATGQLQAGKIGVGAQKFITQKSRQRGRWPVARLS